MIDGILLHLRVQPLEEHQVASYIGGFQSGQHRGVGRGILFVLFALSEAFEVQGYWR